MICQFFFPPTFFPSSYLFIYFILFISITITDSTTSILVTPTIIYSNNQINTFYAKAGDTITLNMTLSKPIYTGTMPNVTIASRAAQVTPISSTQFVATQTVFSTDIQNLVSFSVFNYMDAEGNIGATWSTTSDGSFVNIGNISPFFFFSFFSFSFFLFPFSFFLFLFPFPPLTKLQNKIKLNNH